MSIAVNMEFHEEFIITNDMKIQFKNDQLETKIIISVYTPNGRESVSLDVDKWTEFKKSISDVDQEFYRRFNHQPASMDASLVTSITPPSPQKSSIDTFNVRNEDLVKSGFYRTKCYEQVICCECGWQSGSERLSLRYLNFLHKVLNPKCKMSEYAEDDYINYFNHKKSIENTENIMTEKFIIWPK